MEEKKIKKKKQTLTVSIKKPIDVSRYTQDKGKTSVVIDKQISKRRNERKSKRGHWRNRRPRFTR